MAKSKYTKNWKAKCPRCDQVKDSSKTNYVCPNCERGNIKAMTITGDKWFLGCDRCGDSALFYECECGADYTNQIREVKSYVWLYIVIAIVAAAFLYVKVGGMFEKNKGETEKQTIDITPQVTNPPVEPIKEIQNEENKNGDEKPLIEQNQKP